MELIASFNKDKDKTQTKAKKVCQQLVISEDQETSVDMSDRCDVSTHDNSSDKESSGEYSDSEEHVMHDLINHPSSWEGTADDIVYHTPLSPSSIAAKADDIFCQDYITEAPVKHLPPVSMTLAEKLTEWCRTPPTKEEVKEMFKNALVPINVEGLHPVRINDMLYRKLPFKAKVNDQRLRSIITFLARGCGPLVTVFQELCTLEAAFNKTDEKTVVRVDNEGKLFLDNIMLDVKLMRKKLGDSLWLLTTCHSNILVR